MGAADREALAALAQRRSRRLDARFPSVLWPVEQRAEFIAAHPVRGPAAVEVRGEFSSEALQQRVAGGMAEVVVVVLEAVEVEHHEHERVLGARTEDAALEVGW